MPPQRSERRDDLIVLGLLMLLVTLVYFDVLFLGNNFFVRDLTRYYYPTKKILREVVLSGESPEWNRYGAAGQPMAANPEYEVFYPPQWLILFPDYDLGYRLHILVHVYVAAIGAFLFLRSRRLRRSVAFIGAIAFVLGGTFVSVFNLLPLMFGIAWTPWIALFAARAFESRSRSDLVGLVFFLGLQDLLCEPTTLLQTWFVLGVWGAWFCWNRASTRRVKAATRGFLTAVAAVVASIFLSAVQFLPALDHAMDSVRRLGFPWSIASAWSFPPIRIFEFVFPDVLGTAGIGGVRAFASTIYPHGTYLHAVYIGLPIVALTIAGIVARKKGAGLVVSLLAVSLIFAMGSWTPLFRLLHDLGLTRSIRFPEKFIVMGSLVALAWSCLVLEDLLGGSRRIARTTLALLLSSAAVAACVLAWSCTNGYAAWFGSRLPNLPEHALRVARVHWMIAVVRGIAFAVTIEIVRRTPSRAAVALLTLVVLADLGPLGNQINPRVPERFFDPPPLVADALEAASGSRLLHLASLDQTMDRIQKSAGGVNSYWVLRNGLAPLLPPLWGLPMILERDVDETRLLRSSEFMLYAVAYMRGDPDSGAPWRADAVRQIAGMCNVGAVLTVRPDMFERHAADTDWESIDPVEVHKVNGGARYYFATEVVAVRGVREMFERLAARAWPQAVAFVEGPATVASWGEVLRVDETPDEVELEVEALGDALLVASVTSHKYWSATVDGNDVSIRHVNHTFQGIPVRAGRHLVRMRYFNPLIPAGAATSVTMAAGLVFVLRRGREK